MATINVRMRGENTVPIIIGHRTVTKEPKITRHWRFVGFKEGFKALAAKVIEVIHESFWEPQNEVLEAGQSTIVNYAIQVVDEPGAAQPELVVTRLDGKARPGCGFYCEVINMNTQPALEPPSHPDSKAKAVGIRPKPGATGQSYVQRPKDDEDQDAAPVTT